MPPHHHDPKTTTIPLQRYQSHLQKPHQSSMNSSQKIQQSLSTLNIIAIFLAITAKPLSLPFPTNPTPNRISPSHDHKHHTTPSLTNNARHCTQPRKKAVMNGGTTSASVDPASKINQSMMNLTAGSKSHITGMELFFWQGGGSRCKRVRSRCGVQAGVWHMWVWVCVWVCQVALLGRC